MLIILFKIWCTCLVLTVAGIIMNDYPKQKGGIFDMIVTVVMAGFIAVDVVLLFILMIVGIWS